MLKSRNPLVDELKAEIEELKDERQVYLDMKTESAFEQADEITISIWERENKLKKAGHVTLTYS